MKKVKQMRAQGFTLIEIMIVVAILGLLATFVVGNVGGVFTEAKIEMAYAQCQALYENVKHWERIKGKLPSQAQGLDVLTEVLPTGEAILDELPMDPWGNPYVYEKSAGRKFTVSSYGSDGLQGESDGDPSSRDISNRFNPLKDDPSGG